MTAYILDADSIVTNDQPILPILFKQLNRTLPSSAVLHNIGSAFPQAHAKNIPFDGQDPIHINLHLRFGFYAR